MSEHEQIEESVAAWVLGALDPSEAESVRVHVAACPSCRPIAARLRRAVEALPLEVEEVNPPDRLRSRILAAAAATPRTSSAPRWSEVPARPSPRRWLSDRVPLYAAAAAVLIALLVGTAAGNLAGHNQSPPSNQVARYSMTGHQGLAGAKASVIDLKSDGFTLVDFSGMPALDTDHVYELWLITRDGRADPAAVFVPDTDGSKVVVVTSSLDRYVTMAVTTEKGRVAAPTQQPQMSGAL